MNTDSALIWNLSYADINMYVGGENCILLLMHHPILQRLGKQNHKSMDDARKTIVCHFRLHSTVVHTKPNISSTQSSHSSLFSRFSQRSPGRRLAAHSHALYGGVIITIVQEVMFD